MIDYKPTLVESLRTLGLPVYYEVFVDSETEVPCITYYEMDNTSFKEGDTLRYSRLAFSIKIWGKDLETLSTYSIQIDAVMKVLGFTRTNTVELWLDGIGQRQLKYSALAQETN